MSYERERKTRADRVDPELRWAGWKVVRFDPKESLAAYNGCAIKELTLRG